MHFRVKQQLSSAKRSGTSSCSGEDLFNVLGVPNVHFLLNPIFGIRMNPGKLLAAPFVSPPIDTNFVLCFVLHFTKKAIR